MSIYQEVLKDEFIRLHPMLQKRYDYTDSFIFTGSGVMNEIKGGTSWLFPLFQLGVYWKLLFPERGKDIPFTIKNTVYTSTNGEQLIHWERIFHFKKKKRYFNALMSLDEKRMVIKDYLGEPHLVYSDLQFTVSTDGYLKIESLNQRLVLGKIEIPLPHWLQGLATVMESYDDEKNVYQIKVGVENPLIGTIFSYEGVFTADA